jgi:dimethylamine--corrinoid protein Co-methyltransferase
MFLAHVKASGIGGIRTAGDLAARMKITLRMGLPEDKKYVAEKLKISTEELSNEHVMREVREDLDPGLIASVPGSAKGVETKFRITELLGIEIL